MKSPDLLSANWRPRRANAIVPFWKSESLRPKKSIFFSSSLKAGNYGCPSAINLGKRSSLFLRLFILLRSSIDWMGSTTLGRVICFTRSASSNVNFIKKCLHRHTQNNVDPVTQSSWHTKLTNPVGLLKNIIDSWINVCVHVCMYV